MALGYKSLILFYVFAEKNILQTIANRYFTISLPIRCCVYTLLISMVPKLCLNLLHQTHSQARELQHAVQESRMCEDDLTSC